MICFGDLCLHCLSHYESNLRATAVRRSVGTAKAIHHEKMPSLKSVGKPNVWDAGDKGAVVSAKAFID